MKHLPPEILVTAQLDLMALVKKHCKDCPKVIVPPGATGEPDIFRCRAATGKHCVVAINTSSCIRNTESPDDASTETNASPNTD